MRLELDRSVVIISRVRRTKYLGVAAVASILVLFGLVFFGSDIHARLLRMPNVAAVVSAVLVDLANGDRTALGLGALRTNPVLVAAAQAKANDMASKSYFAHTSPEGLDPWHWFAVVGYSFEHAGENLAADFSDSADVNTAWMNSPDHRKNILDPHFTEIGIATAQGMLDGRPTIFVVQEFGTPASATQQPLARQDIPSDATVIATAVTDNANARPVRVLGSSAPKNSDDAHTAAAGTKEQPPQVSGPITPDDDGDASSVAQIENNRSTPLWGYMVAFPRVTLRYALYAAVLLILLALALETGMELHWHHLRHAVRAAVLLLIVLVLFVVANTIFLTPPTILMAHSYL